MNSILVKGPNFERANTQASTPFHYVDLDLSVAQSNVILQIAGDFIYFDPDPGGVMAAGGATAAGFVVVELNNQQSAPVAPFFAQPGFGLNAIFSLVKLSWPAQAGKKARLMYSTGERVVPTNSATVSGAVSITPQAMPFRRLTAGNFKDAVALGAGASVAMLAPGANVAGAIIRSIQCLSDITAAYSPCSVLAKAGAPASRADGIVLAVPIVPYTTGHVVSTISAQPDLYVAPGLGVYFWTDVAEVTAIHSLVYDLL